MASIIDEQQFYKIILDKIDKDLESKNLKVFHLETKDIDYIISRRQYYGIKNVSIGKYDYVLSNKRLKVICDYFGIDYQVMYQIP